MLVVEWVVLIVEEAVVVVVGIGIVHWTGEELAWEVVGLAAGRTEEDQVEDRL